MSLYRSASRCLIIVATVAGPGGAAAAAIGPTSSGTVSISVTIAPHVAIAPAAPMPALAGAAGGGLCVVSNGFTEFHVAIVRQSASGPELEERLRLAPSAVGLACAQGDALLPSLAPQAANEQASLGAPLTLLIVPD